MFSVLMCEWVVRPAFTILDVPDDSSVVNYKHVWSVFIGPDGTVYEGASAAMRTDSCTELSSTSGSWAGDVKTSCIAGVYSIEDVSVGRAAGAY